MAATKRNTAAVGRDTEQRVAKYLRERGYAGAERAVRTGYRTRTRSSADQGDLTGTPGVCWQVKSLQPATEAERNVRRWLTELEQQRAASRAVFGILVVRRWHVSDTGTWWSFMDLPDLLDLESGQLGAQDTGREWGPEHVPVPVRLELADMVALLERWGWGPGGTVLELAR